jgi:hypothetical protein
MTIFAKNKNELKLNKTHSGLKKVNTNRLMKAIYVDPRHEEKALTFKLLTKEHLCCDQATD